MDASDTVRVGTLNILGRVPPAEMVEEETIRRIEAEFR